jgi:hypothetical protein
MGCRFDVLLTSYETVLKDKTELKKLNYAVSSRHTSSSLAADGLWQLSLPSSVHLPLAGGREHTCCRLVCSTAVQLAD